MTARNGESRPRRIPVERVQAGIRLEKRLLKVLKGLAEYHDLTLADLLEGILLHALEGKSPFGAESLETIVALRQVYGLELDASTSHLLVEMEAEDGTTASRREG